MDDQTTWRKWAQANFTALVLLAILLLSLVATVALMHEDAISDKYVTWLEGFTEAAMAALSLSLRAAGPTPPPAAPGTVITTPATVTTTDATNDAGSGTHT